MFCGKCGTEIDDSVCFCPKCGTPTGKASAGAPAAASAPEVERPKRKLFGKFSRIIIGVFGSIVVLVFGCKLGLSLVREEETPFQQETISSRQIKDETASLVQQIIEERDVLKDYVTVKNVSILEFNRKDSRHYFGVAAVSMSKKGDASQRTALIRYQYESTLVEDKRLYVKVLIERGQEAEVKSLIGLFNWLKLKF